MNVPRAVFGEYLPTLFRCGEHTEFLSMFLQRRRVALSLPPFTWNWDGFSQLAGMFSA